MPALLANDAFVISLITLSALWVRSNEVFSAIIYFLMAWLALAACSYLQVPQAILDLSTDPVLLVIGIKLLICSMSSLLVIAFVYVIRQCSGGKLPGMLIWMCLFEIGMHFSCYVMLWRGMNPMAYDWAVLATQIATIMMFMSRWRWGHGSTYHDRFLRDRIHSL